MASLASGPGSIWGRSDSTHLAWGLLGGKDSKYIGVKLIGYGFYGVVWSAINGETMEKVAVKVIPDAFADATAALRTLREVMLLRQIRHPNVVVLKDMKIPGSVANFKEVYLVYELMDTDLRNVITSKCPLSPDHIKYIIFQILCGLKYLHSANVLHRDLKPANLFLNSNCDLKIGDFGFARTAFPGTDCVLTEYVTTRWYGAPELLLGCRNYGAAVDVWSVGCILAELLGREPIFPGQDFRDQLILIHELLGSQKEEDLEFVEDPSSRTFINSLPSAHKLEFSRMYEHADPLATDLLEGMLVFNPNKRISAAEALEHPYLAGLNDPNLNLCGEHPIVSLDQEDGMKEIELRKMMFTEMLHNLPRRHSRA